MTPLIHDVTANHFDEVQSLLTELDDEFRIKNGHIMKSAEDALLRKETYESWLRLTFDGTITLPIGLSLKGNLLGFMLIRIFKQPNVSRMFKTMSVLQIEELVVTKKARNNKAGIKVGSLMIDWAMGYAQKYGIQKFCIGTISNQYEAMNFYLRKIERPPSEVFFSKLFPK